MLTGKRLIVIGGTGSLGQVLVRRLLSGEMGNPEKVIVFSRDETKQHAMRLKYLQKQEQTDEVIYRNSERLLEFRIGDVRDARSVESVLRDADVVFNAAALKQVPTCEYFPFEAVQTNVVGPENIVRAIHRHRLPVETVVGVSTDKACKPVNVMGMTKALQERILICANLECPQTRFVCVRYGNVLASRGSALPLFHQQIRAGLPITLTSREITRFMLSLNEAVSTVFAAVSDGRRGETYVPRVPACRMADVAEVLLEGRQPGVVVTGLRPGEKLHEILVSEEEGIRTIERGKFYVVLPILPELRDPASSERTINIEYCSADNLLSLNSVADLLRRERLLVEDRPEHESEVLQ